MKEAASAALGRPWGSATRDARVVLAVRRQAERDREAAADQPGTVQPVAGLPREWVQWLWPGRIPLGKLTVLDGDPGLGKSAITLDLAARVSRGAPMPDGSAGDLEGPAAAVVLSAEDGLADTIRPRLEAAGADLAHVGVLADLRGGLPSRPLFLPRDIRTVTRAVREMGARLVAIDPLMAHLDPGLNAGSDQAVRRALLPLATLAHWTGAAVLIVRHLTKRPGRHAVYRGGGSIGILASSRSGLVVAADPQDASRRRVLAVVKANLAEAVPSLGYALESVPGEGDGPPALRVRWLGPVAQSADGLLRAYGEREDVAARDAWTEAMEFLASALEAGPRPASELLAAARAAGLAERTVRRAKAALGVVAQKGGFGGGWLWRLPDRTPPRCP